LAQHDCAEINLPQQTRQGSEAPKNEDAFIVRPDLGMWVVSDGIGGAAAGQLASCILAEAAREVFTRAEVRSEGECVDWVQRAFKLAHERILDCGKEHPHYGGMGCTAELAVFTRSLKLLGTNITPLLIPFPPVTILVFDLFYLA